VKEINLVKKLISLLLISVCLGDTLILKDKTEYTGTLIKFGNDEIMFRALPSAKLSINISDIQELKLSDGTRVIENGIVVASNEKHIKKISYSRYLSVVKAEKVKKRPERVKKIVGGCACIIILGLILIKISPPGFTGSLGPFPGDASF
tara:strand:- start:35 stop:481 length:447 start_codon:yes stop_codon:yes gene_type:complete